MTTTTTTDQRVPEHLRTVVDAHGVLGGGIGMVAQSFLIEHVDR